MPDRFVLMQSFYLITIIATEDWNSQTKSTTSALDRIRWVCVYWCVQICFLLFIFPFVNVCFCWTSVKRIKNEKIDCTFLVSVCARARERVNAIHRIESSRMIVCSIVRWFEWAIAEEKHSHAQNFNNNSYKHNNKRKWNANFVYSLEIIYSLTLIFHRCACVCMRLCVCVCVTECRFCFSCSLPCNGQVFMWPSFTLYTTTRRVHPSIWPNRCELCYVHRNFRNRSIHTFKTEENVYFPFIYFWFAGDRSLSQINVTRTVQLKCIAHVIIQWYADANWNY